MNRWIIICLTLLAAIGGTIFISQRMQSVDETAQVKSVNIYSYRQAFLIQPLVDQFTAETGIEVNIVFAKKGLIERAIAEGAQSPVDLILASDIGRLVEAADKVGQVVKSPILDENIPANYRDREGTWFGLTRRARVIYAAKDQVTEAPLTYEALADPKYKGRICLRSGQHPYNIALFAAMIAHHGEAKTRDWLEGVKANLVQRPAGNDRAQARAIYAGQCDFGIANTYYMGKMQTNEKNPEQKDWADSIRLVFPQFENGGTHVNLSGMVMAKHAPNREAALALMEFLSSPSAQEFYAQVNFEYPVHQSVAISPLVASWGAYMADDLAINDIATHRPLASKLIDEVGFNN